ncbi:MAG: hypothetical protein A2Z18_09525 [Armatimonadetes bacterium RBG_16_58_9]|nr:MAG: hypothetical protein A2Z18_09525 [Armatimonadetes bacterium RBG_16_58_9]
MDLRETKTVGKVVDAPDDRHVVPTGEDTWDVARKMSDLREGEEMVVVDGKQVFGVVNHRKLAALLNARLQAHV